VVPRHLTVFMNCANRNKQRPEMCEREYQTLWNGMIAELQKSERAVKVDLLSESEEETLLDCKILKEKADKFLADPNSAEKDSNEALDKWMRCTIPRVCPEPYAVFQKCMNRGDGIDNCIEEGRPLTLCVADFTTRFSRSLQ